MKLSIVTLNFKKPELTIKCVKSLFDQYKKEFDNNEYECIIVDNNSEDDSVSRIQAEVEKPGYKHVHVIANKRNDGFGAGNNVGAFKSKGELILFLNNDTEVKDDGLRKMVSYMMQHKEVAILGGQLRNPDGSLQPSVGKFYTPFRALLLLLGVQRLGVLDSSPNHIEKVDWVKGAILMMRKELFEKLHGFDENIFMYTEDMELCYRAKKMGFASWFYPNILVIHAEHGSSNRTFAIVNIYKNLLYFYKKHREKWEYHLVKSMLYTKAQLLILMGRITHNIYLIHTYEEALEVLR